MRRTLTAAAVLALVYPAVSAAQESVYKKALKSTVWVVQPIARADGRTMLRTGSGSVIDARQKLIVTNYHVVEDIPDVIVCFPQFDKQGKLIPEKDSYNKGLAQLGIKGKVIARDSTRDLAIIQLPREASLPANTPALRLAKAAPDPGEQVHSIGSPGLSGALFNYAGGSVKSVYQKEWRAMRMANDPSPLQLRAKVIETSSGTNKGDSGGPLLNDKCELVGVTQGGTFGGADSNPISYFIAVDEIREVLKKNKITLTAVSGAATAAADKPKDAPMTASGTTTAAADAEKLEARAASKLDLAKQTASSGKVEKARERYQEIVKEFPGTKAAEEAKKLLEQK